MSLHPTTTQDELILLVEDEPDVREALSAILTGSGYRVATAADGHEGISQFHTTNPSLVLLDIGLPGISGQELCQHFRNVSKVPIIILSAYGSEQSKVAALRAGADDYIVKGVGAAELLARIRVNLDRADMPAIGEESDRLYEDDNLKINYTTQSVWVRGDLVDLTPTEYRLLSFLVANPDTPLSSDFLVRRLWEPGYTSDLVKFHIRYLRQKIELDYKKPSLIMTRIGFGYFYAP